MLIRNTGKPDAAPEVAEGEPCVSVDIAGLGNESGGTRQDDGEGVGEENERGVDVVAALSSPTSLRYVLPDVFNAWGSNVDTSIVAGDFGAPEAVIDRRRSAMSMIFEAVNDTCTLAVPSTMSPARSEVSSP